MRLFVALEIPSGVLEKISAFIRGASVHAPRAKWVRAENLHVTLKFIGETAPGRFDVICSALSEARSQEPVTLEFRGLGFFPDEKRPRVLWVGVEASPNLPPLVQKIEHSLEALGFQREAREFTPHLTLARIGDARLPEPLRQFVAANHSQVFGAVHTGEFHLIESKLKPAGAEYTTRKTFSFAENS